MFSKLSLVNMVALFTMLFTLNYREITALDMESANEMECFTPETKPIDLSWIMSQKIWYYPLASRRDLYSIAIELTEKSAENLQEDEVYYESCITYTTNGGELGALGFGDKKTTFKVTPVKGFEVYKAISESGKLDGTAYNTLTDNKTFIFAAGCMDEQSSWGVMSTIKKLPVETVKTIHEHAESLGFSKKFFTGIRYDQCDMKTDNSRDEF